MEEIVLNIIIHAGNAKAKLYEALQASKENDFDKADNLLKLSLPFSPPNYLLYIFIIS